MPSNTPLDSGSLRITLKDVYQQQEQIARDLTAISGNIQVITTTLQAHTNQGDDHESRLRKLEQWRYALPTSFVMGLASIIIALVEAMK